MSSRVKSDSSFKKGDRVRARWSGSNSYYDAKILEVNPRTYKVQFDDGSVSSIKLAEAKKLGSKESPPKTTKSRSRSRSTGRGKGRSKSRSPARKVAPKKKPGRKSGDRNSLKDESEDEDKPSPKAKTETKQANSVSKTRSAERKKPEVGIRSARLAAKQRSADSVKSPTSTYSSDEEPEVSEVDGPQKTPMSAKLIQVAYFLATFYRIVILPVGLLIMIFGCTRRQCSILEVPIFYSKWRDAFNAVKFPLLGIVGFHAGIILLSFVPLGKRVAGFSENGRGKRPLEYRMNGLLSLILSVAVFAACAYFGVNTNFAVDKFRNMALSAAIYCAFLAIFLHLYALVKKNGTTKTKIPILGTFYNGSYVNPIFFKVNLKTSLIRLGLIGSVLLNLSFLTKHFLAKGTVSYSLGLTTAMQIFVALDLLVREEKLLSTATVTSDTLGYGLIMTLGFLIPFGLASQTNFLYNYESKFGRVCYWSLATYAVLFALGYYIYLTSSNLKHNFRRNPFSPSFSGIASIATSKSKKRLIASGFWGMVRHPNYLGTLIMAIAWSLPCGFAHAIPYYSLALLSIALLVRIYRIEAECKEKYGSHAWGNYTDRVKSRIIPFVF